MLKKILKKITGFDVIETEIAALKENANNDLSKIRDEVAIAADCLKEANEKIKESDEALRLSKLSKKERATELGQPYIEVLDTHINTENIRNGFFELDWNHIFVNLLKTNGYGADGDTEEEIVDRWFRTMCVDVANEMNINIDNRGSGYVNVTPISKTQSEIS